MMMDTGWLAGWLLLPASKQASKRGKNAQAARTCPLAALLPSLAPHHVCCQSTSHPACQPENQPSTSHNVSPPPTHPRLIMLPKASCAAFSSTPDPSRWPSRTPSVHHNQPSSDSVLAPNPDAQRPAQPSRSSLHAPVHHQKGPPDKVSTPPFNPPCLPTPGPFAARFL